MPEFSILIPCYNGEDFVREAVESALAQTMPRTRYEVVVVDDGSTDRTASILESFGGRIRVVRARSNTGSHSGAVRLGLPHLRGDIVVPLDHDDVMMPEKLESLDPVFGAEPSVGYVAHEYAVIDRNGETLESRSDRASVAGSPDEIHELLRRRILGFDGFFCGSSFAVRRSVLNLMLTDDTIPGIPNLDGLVAILVAVHRCRLAFVPRVLCAYRLHPGAGTGQLSTVQRMRFLSSRIPWKDRTWRFMVGRIPGYAGTHEFHRARMKVWVMRHFLAMLRGELGLMGGLLPAILLGTVFRLCSIKDARTALATTVATMLTASNWIEAWYRRRNDQA